MRAGWKVGGDQIWVTWTAQHGEQFIQALEILLVTSETTVFARCNVLEQS
jgi:hypothetical protein